MHLPNFFLRSFRLVLFPFAILFGLILRVRNLLYDKGYIKSTHFNLPIINVGNISVGGTGKSPMVEFLIDQLKTSYAIATLSRGYKRRTKGYLLADKTTTAVELGDEPMQFHLKHPDIAVAVGEERIVAVPQLLYDKPNTQVIILDDAFQHRAITAGFSIILTNYDDLYTRDFYLPTGDLRDNPSSAKRADCIIVTKCPADLTKAQADTITKEIKPLPHQHVFFTSIQYGEPYHILTQENIHLNKEMEVLLICGIANPKPLTNYIMDHAFTYEAMYYHDHHIFTIDELREMRARFAKIRQEKKIMLTTEKDAVRLIKFNEELASMPLYVLPITVHFLFEGASVFTTLMHNFIENFGKSKA